MSTTSAKLDEWTGLEALDCDGESLGEIASAQPGPGPGWLTLRSGLLGRKQSFAPAAGVKVVDGQVVLPWSKKTIKGAPSVSGGSPSDADARALADHYDLDADVLPPPPVVGEEADPEQAAPNTEAPVTHDEESDLRDPESGTRRDAEEMVLPEHRAGIRPHADNDTEIDTTTGEVSTSDEREADR